MVMLPVGVHFPVAGWYSSALDRALKVPAAAPPATSTSPLGRSVLVSLKRGRSCCRWWPRCRTQQPTRKQLARRRPAPARPAGQRAANAIGTWDVLSSDRPAGTRLTSCHGHGSAWVQARPPGGADFPDLEVACLVCAVGSWRPACSLK